LAIRSEDRLRERTVNEVAKAWVRVDLVEGHDTDEALFILQSLLLEHAADVLSDEVFLLEMPHGVDRIDRADDHH